MITIILATIIGLGLTWIASQNLTPVDINIAGVTASIPLYLIGAASFLVGILVTSIFSIFDFSSESMQLAKREDSIKSIARDNEVLRKTVENLRNDNIRLKDELEKTRIDYKNFVSKERKENVRDFFGRIFHHGDSRTTANLR